MDHKHPGRREQAGGEDDVGGTNTSLSSPSPLSLSVYLSGSVAAAAVVVVVGWTRAEGVGKWV